MNDACLFCKIVRGEIPADIIEETPLTLTILDRFPAARGHALVLLKPHREFIHDCAAEETAAIAEAVRRISIAIRKTLDNASMNVLNNNGVVAGQKIPHVHFHIIPRAENDGIRLEPASFDATDEERRNMAKSISAVLKSV